VILAVLLAGLVMAGCGDRRPPDGAAAKPQLDTTYRENLPAGRFQLPTRHTPAPDFFISLPPGYTVKIKSRFPNDEFFILRNDDPSLRDSTEITPGFMRIYVGVNPQSAFDSRLKHTERNVMIGRALLTWYLWSETLPDGTTYYNREIRSSDFYASISPELARAPLNLHIYVAGRDSARVAELATAAETLAMVP
jgi:hypothetical protein